MSRPKPPPPAWAELEASINGRTTFGMLGVRDPDAPCEGFTPGDPGAGRCDTDGHYLCWDCEEMSRSAVLHRKCSQRSSCTCELCTEVEAQLDAELAVR